MNVTILKQKVIKEHDPETKGPVERVESVETLFETHPHELLKSLSSRVSRSLSSSGVFRNNGAVVPLEGTLAEYQKKIGGGSLTFTVSV